ncbi:MAG: GNAT family N-acetyltransferase [Labilithrix sp.]|nr:GNAT family N-acetyltransferase [Labilithrix sp.]
MPRHQAIARTIPDIPRWVEARAYLLTGDCEIFGLDESNEEPALVVRDRSTGFIVVVGAPAVGAIQAAARERVPGQSLVAAPEHAERVARALPTWRRTRAILYELRDPARLPAASSTGDVRFVDLELLKNQPLIPADLLAELSDGAAGSPIVAAFVDGLPVSFCYAGSITESLWDISIDTLAHHRRRGHAARCVTHLIHHMRERGLAPVWAALEENPASWRLAEKLGFVRTDELAFLEPPDDPADVR